MNNEKNEYDRYDFLIHKINQTRIKRILLEMKSEDE